MGVSAFERYQGRYTDEVRPLLEATLQKRVAVRLRVERVVSWDHARLASAAGSPQ